MLADLEASDADPFKDKIYDVCIVGAGVAGITLALEMDRKRSVLLLEGGGLEYLFGYACAAAGETACLRSTQKGQSRAARTSAAICSRSSAVHQVPGAARCRQVAS